MHACVFFYRDTVHLTSGLYLPIAWLNEVIKLHRFHSSQTFPTLQQPLFNYRYTIIALSSFLYHKNDSLLICDLLGSPPVFDWVRVARLISFFCFLSRPVPQCCLYLCIVHSLLRLRFSLPYISNVALPFAHVKKIAIQVLHLFNSNS